MTESGLVAFYAARTQRIGAADDVIVAAVSATEPNRIGQHCQTQNTLLIYYCFARNM